MTPDVVLHLSPHPDDEALGAPATLLGLRDAGAHVVNALVSVGREPDRVRRTAEAGAAAARAGFDVALPSDPVNISGDADRRLAVEAVAALVVDLVRTYRPGLVIGPAPTDAHHGHRIVGEATQVALAGLNLALTWWMWSVWSDLPQPTLYVPFGEDRLDRALHVLGAYAGELERNPYERLVRGRAEANTVLGSERLFGFGSELASPHPYAELLAETNSVSADGFVLTEPRLVDLSEPLRSDHR